jgi:biopolymer transport protein ExbD
MAMRIGDSFGLVTVFASLLVAHSVLMKQYESPRGIPVLLARSCTPSESMNQGDIRVVMVRYRFDHSSFVNNQLMPVEADLRREIKGLMSTRWEQVLSFEADERLRYGEVLSVLSDLKKDDPELFVALLTKSQAGPVDGPQLRLPTYCLP